MKSKKLYVKTQLQIKPNFSKRFLVALDSRVDLNCIQELVLTIYFEKTTQRAVRVNLLPLEIEYKILNVHICNQNVCYKTSFLLVKNMQPEVVLRTPLLTLLYPFKVDKEGIET